MSRTTVETTGAQQAGQAGELPAQRTGEGPAERTGERPGERTGERPGEAPASEARHRAPLRIVPPAEAGVPATATGFAESVRVVGALARRGRLAVPVYRSPPRRAGVDRTIRRHPGATPVVSVRLAGRPAAAVQSDVIEGVVVANAHEGARADRFRRAAWASLEGGGRAQPESSPARGPRRPARVA